jgi:hypothetical protein
MPSEYGPSAIELQNYYRTISTSYNVPDPKNYVQRVNRLFPDNFNTNSTTAHPSLLELDAEMHGFYNLRNSLNSRINVVKLLTNMIKSRMPITLYLGFNNLKNALGNLAFEWQKVLDLQNFTPQTSSKVANKFNKSYKPPTGYNKYLDSNDRDLNVAIKEVKAMAAAYESFLPNIFFTTLDEPTFKLEKVDKYGKEGFDAAVRNLITARNEMLKLQANRRYYTKSTAEETEAKPAPPIANKPENLRILAEISFLENKKRFEAEQAANKKPPTGRNSANPVAPISNNVKNLTNPGRPGSVPPISNNVRNLTNPGRR